VQWSDGEYITQGGAAVFLGVTNLNLDAKGRLAIPAKYREQLQTCCASRLVITIDADHCLLIYPEPTWREIARKLEKLPTFDSTARKLQRLYLGHALEVEMDGQGRVQLSAELRSFAYLDRRAVLLGQGNKLELWDEDTWIARRDAWLDEKDLAHLESSPHFASLSI
jgi:MraZ protein